MNDHYRTDGISDVVDLATSFHRVAELEVREQHPVTDAAHGTADRGNSGEGLMKRTNARPPVRNRTGKSTATATKANDEKCALRAKVARTIYERLPRAAGHPKGSLNKRKINRAVT